jgi:hypothetical protein
MVCLRNICINTLNKGGSDNNNNNNNNNGNMADARSRILEDLTIRLPTKMYCISVGTGSVNTVPVTGHHLESVNPSHIRTSVRSGLA